MLVGIKDGAGRLTPARLFEIVSSSEWFLSDSQTKRPKARWYSTDRQGGRS